MLVANIDVVKDTPEFAKALVRTWFETMTLMSADTAAGAKVHEAMGNSTPGMPGMR